MSFDNWWAILFFFLTLEGYMGDISVVQSPDVIASAVGQNITLDCMFHYGPEKVIHSILYWFRYKNGKREYILHNSSARYNGRIKVLHNSVDLNQSIVLLNVTWDDFGTYHCMMSYSTEQRGPERKSGGGITLLVFDHMTFGRTPWSDHELLCSVNATKDPRFTLNVLKNGIVLSSTQKPLNMSHRRNPSAVVPLEEDEEYECQFNLNSTVILRQNFSSPSDHPEPFYLYALILIIPFIALIVILLAMIIRIIRNKQSDKKAEMHMMHRRTHKRHSKP